MVADDAPRRLHPGTVLISLIKGAPSTLLALPAIVAFSSRGNIGYAVGIALLVTLVTGLIRYVGWRFFTYQLTDDALVIESGVLARNRRTIPFDRVQDVGIERQPLARLLGLAKVSLETGGADQNEAALDSVSLAEAERLRGVIRRRAAEGPANQALAADTADASDDAAIVFRMNLPRVLLWGLFNFSLVWLAVIFGALQSLDNIPGVDMWDPGRWIELERRAEASGQVTVAAGAMLAILFALAGVLAGVLRTVARDGGFALTLEDGRYRRVRGLLTRTETVIALRRVQLAVIESGLIRRRLGWSGLRLQTLGGSDDKGGRQDVAPFARGEEIATVLAPLDLARIDPTELAQVARAHIVRMAIRKTGLPLVAIVAGAILFPPVWFALPLLAVPLVLAMLEKRRHRYAIAGPVLHVQRGVTRRRTWIVPARHVQAISIRRSWLQRRLGTATLLPDTAGGSALSGPAVVDMEVGDTWRLAAQLGALRAR